MGILWSSFSPLVHLLTNLPLFIYLLRPLHFSSFLSRFSSPSLLFLFLPASHLSIFSFVLFSTKFLLPKYQEQRETERSHLRGEAEVYDGRGFFQGTKRNVLNVEV